MQIKVSAFAPMVGVTAQVQGGPLLAVPYSAVEGKKFRVEIVDIDFRLGENGGWKVISHFDIDLRGPVLKKNGGDSQNVAERSPGRDWQTDSEWDWLDRLVRELQPFGSPERMCHDRFEIAWED